MKYGIIIFPIENAIPLVQLAVAAEQRGFDALLLPEHTHIPTSRRSPYIGGGDLPPEYRRIPDPFIALAGVAAATSKIKLGTAVCLVVEHDPIVLAKQVATLDRLCGGRFIFGVGAGWNAEEMANHGTDFKTRWKLLRERVGAMKAIWTQEEPEYHGELVNFDPIWSYPKPAQKPHPPVFLGGHGSAAIKRVIDYCDGWMPILHLMPDLFGRSGADAPPGGGGGARSHEYQNHTDGRAARPRAPGSTRSRRHRLLGVPVTSRRRRRRAALARPRRQAHRAVNRSRKRYLTAKALWLL